MHLLDFQVLSLMNQTQWTIKDICFLKCMNKGFKQNIQMHFLSSNSVIRAFYKWKRYTKMMINDKKYQRRSSWYKKSRSEESALLFF